MIIRNPYGFIVKHFKLINFLLLVPMLYLGLKFGDISTFFNDYIARGYSTPETNFVDLYVNGLTFGIIIFMLIVSAILYFVLSTKKKSNWYYGISVIYYIVLIVALLLFASSMSSIEKGSFEPTFANFVRDCAYIAHLPIYPLMLYNVIRGLGFNIKTLRFDNNSDLKIKEDEDDEELEIKLGSEGNSLKKNVVHIIRELKYYVLENKFVFTCLTVVLLLIVGYTTYANYKIYNRSYSANQAFNLDTFTMSLKESYITNTDYRGSIIADGKYFLAIRIGIENTGAPTSIDKSHFRIYIGNDVIYPSYDRSSRFIDIGEAYQGETIQKGEAHDYVFAYELTKEQVKSVYQMRILSSLTAKDGKLIKKYRKITVRPQNVTKVENLGTVKLNQEISFKKTTLGDTTYLLKDIELRDLYTYKYDVCDKKNVCSQVTDSVMPKYGKTLLIIDSTIKLDESTPYNFYSSKEFYSDFAYISYKYKNSSDLESADEKAKTANIVDITPKALKDKKIYEVPSTIRDASKIQLIIRIRNKYVTIDIR